MFPPARQFMRRGVVIRTVINNFTFDGATKDPMQQAVRDALIGFMAATACAERGGSAGSKRWAGRKGRCVNASDEETDDGRVTTLQSLSAAQLIQILQHHDGDADLTEMAEEELERCKIDGPPPQ
jgi:putative DNA-invertase from lambdoid prophage Rac